MRRLKAFAPCLVICAPFLAAVAFAGCDNSNDNGAHAEIAAQKIGAAIESICGVAEGNGNTGPRTVTAITDKDSDQIGYLVTCVNGKTTFVRNPGY